MHRSTKMDLNPFQLRPDGFHLAGEAVYPSQNPLAAALTFDGAQNGGFLFTGALDTDKRTRAPAKTTLTITRPGTYEYFCLFHAPAWPRRSRSPSR